MNYTTIKRARLKDGSVTKRPVSGYGIEKKIKNTK